MVCVCVCVCLYALYKNYVKHSPQIFSMLNSSSYFNLYWYDNIYSKKIFNLSFGRELEIFYGGKEAVQKEILWDCADHQIIYMIFQKKRTVDSMQAFSSFCYWVF